jgi:hypothetical protein
MRVPVAPFRIAPDEYIRHGGWIAAYSSYTGPLPSEVDHWDYQAEFSVTAHIWLDRLSILEACRLDASSQLTLVVLVRSDTTRIERAVAVVRVPDVHMFDGQIECQLDSSELGGRLTLETLLTTTSPEPMDLLAPDQAGSILWRASSSTLLEGTGAQFPTDSSDFGISHPKDINAGWILEIDLSELDALFMASARLTLNSGIEAVKRMMEGSDDSEATRLRSVLRWDVMRQMVMLALSNDEIVHSDFDAEATSVAGVLRNVLSTVWPTDSPTTIRNWCRTDPSRIEARIQQRSGLFDAR